MAMYVQVCVYLINALLLYQLVGVPPYDGSPDNETMSVPLPVTIVYSLLSIGGIGFSVACLIFISVFRKRK